MELRRTFALLFSIAVFAAALMFSAPAPRSATIKFAPPQHFQQLTSADNFADGDATMAALRQQANAALARLQTAAANRP
jgi:hypothetical protein